MQNLTMKYLMIEVNKALILEKNGDFLVAARKFLGLVWHFNSKIKKTNKRLEMIFFCKISAIINAKEVLKKSIIPAERSEAGRLAKLIN